jgi:hypothetical protein
MRVIIELTEDEARSTTVDRRTAGERPEEPSERQEVRTSDGGSPSGQLLANLGSGGLAMSGSSGLTGDGGAGDVNGGAASNAGEPTGWMSLATGERIE